MARKPKTTNNTIAPNGEERNIPVEKLEEIAAEAAQQQAPASNRIASQEFVRNKKLKRSQSF